MKERRLSLENGKLMENKHIESKTKQNIVINFFLVKKICVAYPYYSKTLIKKIQIKKKSSYYLRS
jgi:hypothetical protein